MNEAERFLEEKLNRGKKPAALPDLPRGRDVRPQPESTVNRPNVIRNDSMQAPSAGKWNGLRYPVAALTSLAVWVAFCFAMAAMGMKGGALTFAILFVVIIPAVWAGMLSLFKD
jgi:hypothetical protein